MSINRRKLSSIVSSQFPEFVREDHQTFVSFLEAYYEYLDSQNGNDLKTIRDIDTTLDSFVTHFRNEFLQNFPEPAINERFLLQNVKQHYIAKGSAASFKFLFRALFNKDVTIEYPSRQILRASDGRWNQDVSIFARVNAGDPDVIVGRIIDVVTPTRILRLQVDRRQYVEVEVNRVVEIAQDIYEFFIDRKFFGNIAPNDRLRYQDIFDATILPTTSTVTIQQKGKNFKLGQLYAIRNGNGAGSILKVSGIDSVGGITSLQFVKYGINYTTDFTATLLPIGSTSDTTAGAVGLTISEDVSTSTWNVNFSESTNGFFEQGIINNTDYNVTDYWDGTYVGDVVREFFVDNKGTILDPDEPAIIKIALGPLAKYPGYYTSNLGFLDDAIYIQDSRYYQAFSYVIKIDEKLESYRSLVKTLVHPAGMAMFGEYDIRNTIDTGTSLMSMIRFLVLQYQDEFFMEDSISAKDFGKSLSDSFSLSSETGSDLARTVPYIGTAKALADHYLNDGITSDINEVTPSDSVSQLATVKSLATHYLNDEITNDTNQVSLTEDTISYGYGSLTRVGIGTLNTTKLLNDTATISELKTVLLEKPLGTHYLNDGVTNDDNEVLPADDSSYVLNKQLDIHYLNDEITNDDNEAAAVDSGGYLWLNAYTDPYPASQSYFANDSGNYTTGESAF